jgi:hypothetical protein
MPDKNNHVAALIGLIPNRLQLAGGWIDQPFISRHNPKPPGSMVVVQIEPDFRPMDRSGIASGTRAVAMKLWKGKLPNRPPAELVRTLICRIVFKNVPVAALTFFFRDSIWR